MDGMLAQFPLTAVRCRLVIISLSPIFAAVRLLLSRRRETLPMHVPANTQCEQREQAGLYACVRGRIPHQLCQAKHHDARNMVERSPGSEKWPEPPIGCLEDACRCSGCGPASVDELGRAHSCCHSLGLVWVIREYDQRKCYPEYVMYTLYCIRH